MAINLDTLIHIPETVYTQEVGEETILLDTRGGRYFSLDPVGTRMWQLIREHGALRQVYETLLTEYEVVPERLEADLLALAAKMIDKGLASIKTEQRCINMLSKLYRAARLSPIDQLCFVEAWV